MSNNDLPTLVIVPQWLEKALVSNNADYGVLFDYEKLSVILSPHDIGIYLMINSGSFTYMEEFFKSFRLCDYSHFYDQLKLTKDAYYHIDKNRVVERELLSDPLENTDRLVYNVSVYGEDTILLVVNGENANIAEENLVSYVIKHLITYISMERLAKLPIFRHYLNII